MIKEQTHVGSGNKIAQSVDRRSKLSRKELIKEYIEPSIPVILTDAVDHWKAVGKFSPEFFKTTYGHMTKEVKGITYTFSDFVDRMMVSTPENPSPYPFNLNVEQYFPELLKDMQPEIIYGKIDRINHPFLPRFMTHGTEVYEIFLGGKGSSFPFLHIDALFLHNQATMLYGSKDFILYSPDQIGLMYPRKESPKYSNIDILNPDYEKYPLFREAKSITVTLNQGETLLFPTGWWHTTIIHEPCISFGRAHLSAANWSKFIKDEARIWKTKSALMANLVIAYGSVLGKFMNLQELFV
jgi:histone arginine demethylase JMJD6